MCDSYNQEQQQLETRLRSMTNPELIGYANTKPAASVLEKELVKRFELEIFEEKHYGS